jgi:mannan endo-1,4-beta-mannosidase
MNKSYLLALCSIILLSSCSIQKNGKQIPQDKTMKANFKTLNFLYKVSGKHTIAGIHNREPNAEPARWTNEMAKVTGKFPGLWSGDFLFQKENIDNRGMMINEAIKQWKTGAVVNIMWHACNPALLQPCGWDDGSGVLSNLTNDQWKELTTNGTKLNMRWKEMMDEISVGLQKLKDNRVEVLFRPLHEMNQGKFWWGGRPGEDGTVKLWRITHDYLTKEKALSNLIWVWDIQDFPNLANDVKSYFPGDAYFDVAALDVYDKTGFTKAKYDAMLSIPGGKPIAIGECDRLPTLDQLNAQPNWTFFMSWSELTKEKNTDEFLKMLYNSDRVITLDEMPQW